MNNFFKWCLRKLKEIGCVVAINDGNYISEKERKTVIMSLQKFKKEVDLNKIYAKIPCTDPIKKKKKEILLDCYYELRGGKKLGG
jgi:phage gp16-like protein